MSFSTGELTGPEALHPLPSSLHPVGCARAKLLRDKTWKLKYKDVLSSEKSSLEVLALHHAYLKIKTKTKQMNKKLPREGTGSSSRIEHIRQKKNLSNVMKDMNNTLNKLHLFSIYMQPLIVRYQLNEDKHEVVLLFLRTSFHLALSNLLFNIV